MNYAEWHASDASEDFYSCDRDGESLSHEFIHEAIEKEIDDRRESDEDLSATLDRMTWPLRVDLYEREKVDAELFADSSLENLVQDLDDEFGYPNGGVDNDAAKALRDALVAFASTYVPWRCRKVGFVELTREEVVNVMSSEGKS